MALPSFLMDDVCVGDLSCDQWGESAGWIELLSWEFIYLGKKHHFSGWWMSGPVSLGKIKNRDFVLALRTGTYEMCF